MFDKVEEAVFHTLEHAKSLDQDGQHNGDLIKMTEELINLPEFQICSGSSKPEQHHYGDHGLLMHTIEVIRTCLQNHWRHVSRFSQTTTKLNTTCTRPE